MKKSILLFAGALTLIACGPSQEELNRANKSIKITKETKPYGNSYPDISVVEYDSCEYILSHVYLGEAITHKGNCKYCITRNKKP